MFYLSTYLQWFANYRWKTAEQDDKSAFTVPKGPFRVNSQDMVKAPSPIFLKFYSNCHYPIWWTSAKFEWNLSINGMIIKLCSWGCSQGGTNSSCLAMFKALLLPNYISEQPQYFGDASNFAKCWKNNIIYIMIFKGQRSCPPHIWLLLSLATNFRKFSNLATVLFLDIFPSYLKELLLIKLSLT